MARVIHLMVSMIAMPNMSSKYKFRCQTFVHLTKKQVEILIALQALYLPSTIKINVFLYLDLMVISSNLISDL